MEFFYLVDLFKSRFIILFVSNDIQNKGHTSFARVKVMINPNLCI